MGLVQLIIARRMEGWILIRDGHPVGLYRTIGDARDVAAMIAEQAKLVGDECELMIHDAEWRDEPCSEADRPAL